MMSHKHNPGRQMSYKEADSSSMHHLRNMGDALPPPSFRPTVSVTPRLSHPGCQKANMPLRSLRRYAAMMSRGMSRRYIALTTATCRMLSSRAKPIERSTH